MERGEVCVWRGKGGGGRNVWSREEKYTRREGCVR